MLCTELFEMVYEMAIMTRESKIKFRICASVFFFVLHIACILKYIFFCFQVCFLTLSFQYFFHVHTKLTFFQSYVNYEYRNDYAGSQQGLLSSATPSHKYYLVFVLCSFHYYRQIVSSCIKITLYSETQTMPKYVFTAVK